MQPLNSITLGFKCPKAFDELVPCNGGWYCNGCHKLVHDMRGKIEVETQALIAKRGYKLCGLFEADRIRVKPSLPKWRKWLSAAVLAVGFTGWYQTLMAQQISKPDLTVADRAKITAPTDTNATFGIAIVEIPCDFPGGIEKFQKFLAINLKPDSSCHPGEKAFFSFTVEKDGRITEVTLIRSPFSKAMNTHIIAVLERSPRWRAGQRMGKVIRSRYTMPIVPLPK